MRGTKSTTMNGTGDKRVALLRHGHAVGVEQRVAVLVALVQHLAVAVVGRDHQRAAGGAHGLEHSLERDVHRLDRDHRRVDVAGVADHVARREVGADEVVANRTATQRMTSSAVSALFIHGRCSNGTRSLRIST